MSKASPYLKPNIFLTPLNTSRKNNNSTSSFLQTVKESTQSKTQPNENILDDFKSYMKLKIKNKQTTSPKKGDDSPDMINIANNHVERIIHNKYKLKGHDMFKKFEDKMKVFRILDSYVDVKDYLKKMNLLYNPQMKEILQNKKKKALRSEFQNSFGVNINELELPYKDSDEEEFPFNNDLMTKEHSNLISKVKATLSLHRKIKTEEDEVFSPRKLIDGKLDGELKHYLAQTLRNPEDAMSKEHETNSQNQIFERIDEYYHDQKQENIVRIRSKLKNFREATDPTKSTHYAKEMEKFQNLIENSIDFNLIKQVKLDEEDVPSKFYYLAYKKHAQQVQKVLKKTCQKLYSRKLEFISTNKTKLSNRIQQEAEKLQNFINVKVIKKNSSKIETDPRNRSKSKMTSSKDPYNASFSQKSQIFIPKTITSLDHIEEFDLGPKFGYQKKNKKLPKLVDSNGNLNIKTKFSNLINRINVSQVENADKKMLIEKEIDDIENVFQKELEQIKLKQFHRVESIRDVKVEEKVETKVKMLKSYFSNRKKGKYIIKL